jgi:hypothetical protein
MPLYTGEDVIRFLRLDGRLHTGVIDVDVLADGLPKVGMFRDSRRPILSLERNERGRQLKELLSLLANMVQTQQRLDCSQRQ